MKKQLFCFTVFITVLFLTAGCGQNVSLSETCRGKTQDKVYTNDFFDFCCTLDGDWVFMTEEEMTESGTASADIFFSQEEQKPAHFMDMAAFSAERAENINIVIQKDQEKKIETEAMAAKYIADFRKESLDIDAESILTEADYLSVSFAGSTHYAVRTVKEWKDAHIYQYQIICKKDSYYAIVTLTGFSEDAIEEMLDLFHSVSQE